MKLRGAWLAVIGIALAGVIVIAALTAFTDVSETGLFIVGAVFGVAAGIAIVATTREDQDGRSRGKKRR